MWLKIRDEYINKNDILKVWIADNELKTAYTVYIQTSTGKYEATKDFSTKQQAEDYVYDLIGPIDTF